MNPNISLWEKGDFTKIAETMRESGTTLVNTIDVKKLKVMEFGCGGGTTALPAARLGANVLIVDIASNIVDRMFFELGWIDCSTHSVTAKIQVLC